MILALLLACVPIHLPEPSLAMVALAREHAPEASFDSLTTGRTLVLKRCANCHRPPKPESVLAEDWAEIFPKMGVKAKLQPEDLALIEAYLVAAQALPPEPG